MTGKGSKVLNSEYESLGFKPKDNNRIRKADMSPTLAAKGLLREAFPLSRYGKLENVIHHVTRFISPRVTKAFTKRRARAIWDGEARRIDSEEMDALRAALIEESKVEARELRARLAALDEKIAAFDAVTARQALEARR